MKIKLIILSTFLPSLIYSQEDITKESLIGTWKFIELQDENGIKHTEINKSYQEQNIIELINRSDYIFFDNGEYKYLNKYSAGGGKWSLNKTINTIDLSQRIGTDDSKFQTLLEYHVITKADDGLYYQEPTSLRIERYNDNELVIADNYPYVLLYKKVNETHSTPSIQNSYSHQSSKNLNEIKTLIIKETQTNGLLDFFTPIQDKENDGYQIKPGVFASYKEMALYNWAKSVKDLGIEDLDELYKIYSEARKKEISPMEKNLLKMGYNKELE